MAKKAQFSIENEVVKRSNTTIGISPKQGAGNLTVLVRRLFNVLVHFTMKDGDQDIYRRPLREVLRYIDYNSNDLVRIKEHLDAMASTPIHWDTSTDDDDIWTTTALIGHASIIKPKKKGLPAFIEWSFSHPVRLKLLQPQQWTQLKLVMHTKLKSGASISLFEVCSRYKGVGRTVRQPYEWWVPTLTGAREESLPEYKYFKRDVLRHAIAEVNFHSEDFAVDLIEHKVGNRVAELQFAVVPKQPRVADERDDEAPAFDAGVLERVMRLGFPEAEARRICQTHDATQIIDAVEYTEKRARETTIGSKAAYFRTSLKNGYKEQPKPKKQQSAEGQASLDLIDPLPQAIKANAEQATQRRDKAYGYWRDLDSEPQKELLNQFLMTDPGTHIRTAIRKNALGSMVARTAFCDWLATELWGEQTAAELLGSMEDGHE